MKIICAFLITCVVISIKADFRESVSKSPFYKINSSAFEKDFMKKNGFRWNDKSKMSARSFRGVTFLKQKVTEAIVEFGKEGVKKVSLYFYNRGDDGNIKELDFKNKVTNLRKLLNGLTKANERVQKKTGATKADSSFWLKDNVLFKLIYNGGPTAKRGPWQSEFIRLDMNFNEGKFANVSKKSFTSVSNARKNVVKKDNGDYLIPNVPMVDQGQKGYCACATTARVLQYFGREVDQHEIAQLALSTASQGTNPEQLYDSLKKMRTKFKLSVSELVRVDLRFIKKLARYYDKMAKGWKASDEPAAGLYGGFFRR